MDVMAKSAGANRDCSWVTHSPTAVYVPKRALSCAEKTEKTLAVERMATTKSPGLV